MKTRMGDVLQKRLAGPWNFVIWIRQMMVGVSGVIDQLDSPTDDMDLIEDGVGQVTCFCEGIPASKLDSRQDVVPYLQFLV